MKDLFGNEIKKAQSSNNLLVSSGRSPESGAIHGASSVVWVGRTPIAAEKKQQKVEDLACLTNPRAYSLRRESKTTVWILNH